MNEPPEKPKIVILRRVGGASPAVEPQESHSQNKNADENHSENAAAALIKSIRLLNSLDKIVNSEEKTQEAIEAMRSNVETICHAVSQSKAHFACENGLCIVFREIAGLPEYFSVPEALTHYLGAEKPQYRVVNNCSEFSYTITEARAKEIAGKNFAYETTQGNAVVQHKCAIGDFDAMIRVIELFKQSNVAPELPKRNVSLKVTLTEHETAALEKARAYKRFAFLDSPGMGKSLASLVFLLEKGKPVIVVAPATLHEGWMATFSEASIECCVAGRPDDIANEVYTYQREGELVYLDYAEAMKFANFTQIFNNGTLSGVILLLTQCECQKMTEAGLCVGRASVLVDEFHEYKDPAAKRTRELLRSLLGAQNVALLTATPALNNISEVYTLLAALGLKCSHNMFEERYCVLETVTIRESTVKKVIGSMHVDELKDLLECFSSRRTYAENTKIPSVERRVLKLDDSDGLKRTFGDQYLNERSAVAEALVDRFCTILATINQEVVVFFASLALVPRISRECPVIVGATTLPRRCELIRDFQTEKLQKIAVSLECAAVGIDLATAKLCFFLQLDWTASGIIEAEGRLRRISSPHKIIYSILVTGDSDFEKRIGAIIERKSKQIDGLYEDEIVQFSKPWNRSTEI